MNLRQPKIFVLGERGMLGRYVMSWLSDQYGAGNVVGINREYLDAIEDVSHVRMLGLASQDVVINCMGVIKPRVEVTGEHNTYIVNSLFPCVMAEYCESVNASFVHITTDCVFSGSKGSYVETDAADQLDVYGLSKYLGENHGGCTIRTSIIGEESGEGRSFVEWLRSNGPGEEVFGFTNHLWNGVTCLQLAKMIGVIIEKRLYWSGVRHLFTPFWYTKHDMVTIMDKEYGLGLKIVEKKTDNPCDRTLGSIYKPLHRGLIAPSLETQIQDMRNYQNFPEH